MKLINNSCDSLVRNTTEIIQLNKYLTKILNTEEF